jgi:hypothetical protein
MGMERFPLVMRGLDPRIHLEKSLFKEMDCRVKPKVVRHHFPTTSAAAYGSRPAPGRRRLFSRHDLPELLQIRLRLFKKRAQGMPGARCTRGLVC